MVSEDSLNFISFQDLVRISQLTYLLKPHEKKEFLESKNIPTDISTVALIDEDQDAAYMKSTAVIHTFKLMSFPYWALYYPCIIVPRFLRDGVYGVVSKYRMALFGKK